MAKLTVIITVLLFSLAISVASSKSENDIIADHLPPTLTAEPDPDTTNPTLSGSGSVPELASSDEVIVPMNFVNFHPINRHFPRRPLTTTHFNHRPCHHHHRQIPYGNDMIYSDEEKTTDPLSDDVVVTDINMLVGPFALEEIMDHPDREIDNSGEDDGSMKITVTRVKLMKRKEERQGEKENTLGRKIRKFLNHLV
ncbi:hypothetical protein AALP_AA6G315000 [Arabis alpina]|uniref:Uncharacterized protein n=1 Tax=Arabis alpina TaxID=50452 RepID=A0A087GSY8_ARAAL|nr:hypothetical protein AALP_AA6G315000 [Arabis alpina]